MYINQSGRWHEPMACESTLEGNTFVFVAPDFVAWKTSWRAESERMPLSPSKTEAAAIA
jgi:hypothetical protein